jgi:predicted MPP superfamily phosphohydrolase
VSAQPDSVRAEAAGPRLRRYLLRTGVVAALYFGVLVYPVLRLLGLLLPGWTPGTVELLVIIIGPIAGRVLYERYPNRTTRLIAAGVLTWLGLCFLLFAMLLPFELANLLVPLPAQPAGLALAGLLAGFGITGFINAQLLHVERVEVPATDAVRGKRVVQISDVHIGSRSPALLERIVAKTNALAPDYVLITGDLIDFAGISRKELAPLGRFTAPAYFAIGNHERYVDLTAIDERLRALGITVLRDEARLDGPFQFIGIDDVDKPAKVAASLTRIDVSNDHYSVLLYHRPDGFEPAAEKGIALMLAGHTHAGQLIPFNLLVKRVYPRIRGLYEIDGARLYVSPGTGTWGPILRLGSRSEITLIEFV